jgi:hypothetical protein
MLWTESVVNTIAGGVVCLCPDIGANVATPQMPAPPSLSHPSEVSERGQEWWRHAVIHAVYPGVSGLRWHAPFIACRIGRSAP